MQRADNDGASRQNGFEYGWVFRRLLLIFQMPKTGSQTVEASLQQCRLPDRIARCHFLSSARLAELRQSLRADAAAVPWQQQMRRQLDEASRLRLVLRLRNLLRACQIKIPKLQIITAIREPIGLGLSSVFQNYLYFVPTPDSLTPEKCSEFLRRPRLLKSLEEWFERELQPIVRLDVYRTPFPREQGYQIYENACARVLLYKFEALPRLEEMIQAFMGCRPPSLATRNRGSEKPYGKQYDYAKRHLRLPAEFVRESYGSKMVRHFYSPQELSDLTRRWTEGEAGRDITNRGNGEAHVKIRD